ncbi:MAG: hypothetical protein CV087_13220 [Candidatus Brocadia sp. WS118]|nr:MAG: hypothetical protein CV087_13220 [Candidatus Brocadia sp. WS118]
MALIILATSPLYAQHIARRLGHPTTRFADPIHTPKDLRDRFSSEELKSDIAVIVNLCDGWQGDIEDFYRAAATASITSLQIPIGARLPAMSARKNGELILHRDVLWMGNEPIDAYEFSFYSKGRRYRCVTPKLCCNFWVEDLGPDPRAPFLTIECNTPAAVSVRRPVKVCLTVKNTGDAPDELVTVKLSVPTGAIFVRSTGETNTAARRVVWRISNLAPGSSKRLCADFNVQQPGSLTFESSARGVVAQAVETWCSTRVSGIPAVLFEVIDLEDPIEVGQQNTYELRVINQGSTTLTNVKIVCPLEPSQQYVSCTGATTAQAQKNTITTAPLATLSPKDTAKWHIVVKSIASGDVRFAAELSSDQFQRPIKETEATRQY